MTHRLTAGVLTGLVVVSGAYANTRAGDLDAVRAALPIFFGLCLAAFVSVDSSTRLQTSHQRLTLAASVRRPSRLIYLWLYLLVGCNEIAAWCGHYAFSAAAARLGWYLLAGIVVLIMVRLSAAIARTRQLACGSRLEL